jgi:large subunit ribosomal protein L1
MMAKHGKKYLAAAAKVDQSISLPPAEALKLAKETSTTKFDATVEVHMRLGVDPRHADQQVRDVVVLPHGLGKTVRVLVFAQGEGANLAREAGADVVADDDETLGRIQAGWTEFDVAIATPDMMSKVGRLGRILGPRGLMPNPKAGTVVPAEDLPRVINEAKAGRVEFRVDKTSNLHVPIGKVSFTAEKLYDNLAALMEAVKKARPAAAKGTYLKRITVTTTMGPGIKIDPVMAQSMEVRE